MAAQRPPRRPHLPPQVAVELPLRLEPVQLAAGPRGDFRGGAEIANLLSAAATEPQLDHPLARAPPFDGDEPALPQGLPLLVAQREPSKAWELGGEIT